MQVIFFQYWRRARNDKTLEIFYSANPGLFPAVRYSGCSWEFQVNAKGSGNGRKQVGRSRDQYDVIKSNEEKKTVLPRATSRV